MNPLSGSIMVLLGIRSNSACDPLEFQPIVEEHLVMTSLWFTARRLGPTLSVDAGIR